MIRLVCILFFLGTSALLIGNRFGYAWTGGQGYEPSLSVLVTEIQGRAQAERNGNARELQKGGTLARGETVRVPADGRVAITVGRGTTIALDERTEIVLERLTASEVTIRLHGGRILAVSNPEVERLTVRTNDTQSSILEGTLSAINYDFQRTVSFVPFDISAEIRIKPDRVFFTDRAVSIEEVEPFAVSYVEFNAEAPSVKEFYTWASEMTGFVFPER